MASQNISQDNDQKVLIICLIIAIIFVIMRSVARYVKIRQFPLAGEDLFIYLAIISFAIMSALYLATLPTYFRVEAIFAGLEAPYATLPEDLLVMLKEFFVVQIFFWLTLWAVKLSLLFMFRRLTEGLPAYRRIWWAVLLFTIATFVGAVISNFTSCSSMHAWFTAGECSTPRDARAKAASLWYCLAVDLITDMMIMAIPVRLLWNLQISLAEKLSLAVVFTVGLITMVFAIVRVVSLDASTSGGQVSTTWLILWAGIEGVVAIIVGCLPSFAVFIRSRVVASRNASGHMNPSYPTYPTNPVNSLQSARSKAKFRTQSVLLEELELSDEGGSKKSLVNVRVGGGGDERSERSRGMEEGLEGKSGKHSGTWFGMDEEDEHKERGR